MLCSIYIISTEFYTVQSCHTLSGYVMQLICFRGRYFVNSSSDKLLLHSLDCA
jgi:hypothetical protein